MHRGHGCYPDWPISTRKNVVIGAFPGERGRDVLFLIWDWFYSAHMTIVSDGFTTHGGEGGRGLSTTLGFIQYYQIPLLEVWISDREAFHELAQGTFTEDMFDTVSTRQKPYDWSFHPLPSVEKVQQEGKTFLQRYAKRLSH